ncbi:MAG TPA: 4Fe-4S binding protein [bacterium]
MSGKTSDMQKIVQGGKENAKITIYDRRCKGCEICVKFCPTQTLAMDSFVAVVANIDACNKCMRCELLCPDYAITVE